MNKYFKKYYSGLESKIFNGGLTLLVIAFLAMPLESTAQALPDNTESSSLTPDGDVKEVLKNGNELYRSNQYTNAEKFYRTAKESAANDKMELRPTASYNLGNSLYRQGKYDEAIGEYADMGKMDFQAYHNLGNAYLQKEQYKEAIGAYKNALKADPTDLDTKYNLSYAIQKLKDKNKDGDNKNQNQDQDKDQNQDQDQDKQDKNQQDKQNQDKQQNKDKNKEKNQKDDQQDGQNNDSQNQEQNKQDGKQDGNQEGQEKGDKSQADDKNKQDKNSEDKAQDGENDGKKETGKDKAKGNENSAADKTPKANPLDEKAKMNNITKEEAMRILQALKNEEKNVQKKIRKSKGKPSSVKKNW